MNVSPLEIEFNDDVNITAILTNYGGVAGDYDVILQIDGINEPTQTISVESEEEKEISFVLEDILPGEHIIQVGRLSSTFTVNSEKLAAFEIQGLSISPREAEIGENITINARISNNGNISGTYTANLLMGNDIVESQDIEIGAGITENVYFYVTKNEPGTYSASVDGLAVSFEILPESVPDKPFPWLVLIGIGEVIVVTALIILLIMNKRKKAALKLADRGPTSDYSESIINMRDFLVIMESLKTNHYYELSKYFLLSNYWSSLKLYIEYLDPSIKETTNDLLLSLTELISFINISFVKINMPKDYQDMRFELNMQNEVETADAQSRNMSEKVKTLENLVNNVIHAYKNYMKIR